MKFASSSDTKTPAGSPFQNSNPGKENPYIKLSGVKYFRCLQQGHKSNECPNQKQLHILEAEAEEENESNDSASNLEIEDVQEYEGEPLMCIFEKLLIALRQPNTSQQHAILRTKCTI